MSRHNVNIYFSEKTYNKIKPLIAQRKVSKFVNNLVERELAQEEKKVQEQLEQQLIHGYQARAKDKKLQRTLQTYGKMSWQDLTTKLGKTVPKNGKSKK